MIHLPTHSLHSHTRIVAMPLNIACRVLPNIPKFKLPSRCPTPKCPAPNLNTLPSLSTRPKLKMCCQKETASAAWHRLIKMTGPRLKSSPKGLVISGWGGEMGAVGAEAGERLHDAAQQPLALPHTERDLILQVRRQHLHCAPQLHHHRGKLKSGIHPILNTYNTHS